MYGKYTLSVYFDSEIDDTKLSKIDNPDKNKKFEEIEEVSEKVLPSSPELKNLFKSIGMISLSMI